MSAIARRWVFLLLFHHILFSYWRGSKRGTNSTPATTTTTFFSLSLSIVQLDSLLLFHRIRKIAATPGVAVVSPPSSWYYDQVISGSHLDDWNNCHHREKGMDLVRWPISIVCVCRASLFFPTKSEGNSWVYVCIVVGSSRDWGVLRRHISDSADGLSVCHSLAQTSSSWPLLLFTLWRG